MMDMSDDDETRSCVFPGVVLPSTGCGVEVSQCQSVYFIVTIYLFSLCLYFVILGVFGSGSGLFGSC